MITLHTHAKTTGVFPAYPVKVLDIADALATNLPRQRVIARLASDAKIDLTALARLGFGGILAYSPPPSSSLPALHSPTNPEVVDDGDVIQVRPGGSQVTVLYRRRSTSNSLFITERCNSFCLMCSQPPRDADDTWRIDELKQLVELIDQSLPTIGVTGGEPTLLRERLAELLMHVKQHLPSTTIHVLTNGRLFASSELVEMFDGLQRRVIWGIPLYGATPSIHDHVVQCRGAFVETIEGIYNLRAAGHAIELRHVLHKQTADKVGQFAEFVGRNLPFVDHMAFMGLEPMGFAKVNRDQIWIDPLEYVDELVRAATWLDRCGIATSLFNLPLCILPRGVWRFARKSISDWKRVYAPACEGCDARLQCGGFFRSAGADWQSKGVRPMGVLGDKQ